MYLVAAERETGAAPQGSPRKPGIALTAEPLTGIHGRDSCLTAA